ncbi:hypothetical protein ACQ4PT_023684 [Festuca glaucescens]
MAAHPDGSNRVFLSNQAGKVFLATVPPQGSGKPLELDVASPFLDITDRGALRQRVRSPRPGLPPGLRQERPLLRLLQLRQDAVGVVLRPVRMQLRHRLRPVKLGADNGAQPCQYQSVIAEYTANSSPARRQRPPREPHGGEEDHDARAAVHDAPRRQILFGPADGYMYFMMGDGGSVGDPWNFAQNKGTLLGKIVRIDVNDMPSGNSTPGWGNYGIPKDNPFSVDPEFAPEVFALGFKNPWRCSFDSGKPSNLFCADVGTVPSRHPGAFFFHQHETSETIKIRVNLLAVFGREVDLVVKGGNYGWRVFEGHQSYPVLSTPGGNTSADSINAIAPVMGYTHNNVNNNVGSASVTGGYVYRSMTDPCLNGRYIYSDLYAQAMWSGLETPENSGCSTRRR